VFTGAGTNSESVLYWNRAAGVWDDMGDCVRLLGSDGQVLSKFALGGGLCPGG
jgi:hypothetical protein